MNDRVKSVIGALIGVFAINLLYGHAMVGHALFSLRIGEVAPEILSVVATGTGLISVLVTVLALLPRLGPRLLFVIGGSMAGVGYCLAALALHLELYALLYVAGVLAGAGMGITLVLPISVLVRWFEKHSGLWIGIAFAVGALGVHTSFATIWSLSPADGVTALGWGLAVMGATGIGLFCLAGWLVRFPATSETQESPAGRVDCGPGLGTLLRSGWLWIVFGVLCLTEIATRWHLVHNLISLPTVAENGDVLILLEREEQSLIGLAIAAGPPVLIGLLADRIGRFVPMLVAAIALAAIIGVKMLAPSPATAYLSYYGLDVLGGGLQVLGVALAASIFGAVAYPRVYAIAFALAMVGSVALQFIREWTVGSPQKWLAAIVAYVLLAVLALVGLLIARSRKANNPQSAP